MKKLILKFNNRAGKDMLPKVLAISEELGLKVEKMEERKTGGTLLQTVHLGGDATKLRELDQRMIRFASVTRKAA